MIYVIAKTSFNKFFMLAIQAIYWQTKKTIEIRVCQGSDVNGESYKTAYLNIQL